MANEELAKANKQGAFMRLMRRSMRWGQKLYATYQSGGWLGVHEELVQALRVAEREHDKESDELARAIGEVLQYQVKGYGLGRCAYVPANPIPKGADPDEVDAHELLGEGFSKEADVLNSTTAKYFSHYFLSASNKRIPKWCPDCSLSARQRTHRKRKLKASRSGKYI